MTPDHLFDLDGRFTIDTGGNECIGGSLSSRASDYVTGAMNPVDGEYSIR